MAVVGLSVFAGYLAGAYLSYRVILLLWSRRPGLTVAVATVSLLALLLGAASYRYSTGRLLAALDATPLPRERAPELYRRLDRLTERMRVGDPELSVARMRVPNAFAIGDRRRGVVVFDRALLSLLSADELEALLAHELAHVESYDGFVQTLAYSAFSTVVELLFVLLLPVVLLVTGASHAAAWLCGRPTEPDRGPGGRARRWIEGGVLLALLLVTITIRAHSRRREYAADDRAAAVTGDPLALARALRTIDRAAEPRWGIVAPLYVHTDDEDGLLRLLSTHPPIDDRIERLAARAAAPGGRRIEVE